MTTVDSIYESEESVEERIRRAHGAYSNPGIHDALVHVDTLDPQAASLIRRTEKVATDFAPEMPSPSGPSLKGRVSLDGPQNSESEDLIDTLSSFKEELIEIRDEGKMEFPNVAYEFVKLGLQKEKFLNDKINGHVREANKIQKQIDLLLDLQSHLNALNDDASEMPQKMKDVIAELKELGVDVWKEEEFGINKENVAKLKSHASSQVDKLRSNLQIIFTTKIQVFIQMISSILEIVKESIHNDTRGKSRILQNMAGK